MHLWAYQVNQWTERSLPCGWAGVVDAGCLTLCQTFLKAKGRLMPRSSPLAVSSDTTERSPQDWILNICSPSRRSWCIDLGNDWRGRIKKELSEGGRAIDEERGEEGEKERCSWFLFVWLVKQGILCMRYAFVSHNLDNTTLKVCASGLKGPAGVSLRILPCRPTESYLLCVLVFFCLNEHHSKLFDNTLSFHNYRIKSIALIREYRGIQIQSVF